MKIGITCYPLIGGSGILATALGQELARRGHMVDFFSSAKPVRLDLAQERVAFHEVTVSEYSLFTYPDYTLPLAVKMAGVARTKGLDVFHVHYAVPHAIAAYLAVQMLARTQEQTPSIVTTLHGTDTTMLGHDPGYRESIEYALAQSDSITTVSHSLQAETAAVFRLDKPVEVIPNFFIPSGPRRERGAIRRELGVAEEEFLVIHTSNARRFKRIDLLLRVFAAAARLQPMRLLVLAGGAFAPYESLLDELEVRDRVIVRENVLEVEDYIAAADAGLYTSEVESFGLSILETCFHAKPVVAYRVGGIPEVISDGKSGLLHPFGEIDSMAASLVRLARSPELRQTLGAAAQREAQQRFSAERVVPQYEALYRRLVE